MSSFSSSAGVLPGYKVYGIKNCDTMKKAFAWLDSKSIIYAFVDYRKAGVAAAQLSGWVRRVGWERLLNTRGMTWRKLAEEERRDVDETKALALMTAHPNLIRRPVVVSGDGRVLAGFDAAAWEDFFRNE